MKHKVLVFSLILITACTSVFASGFDYSFDLLSLTPIYKEYDADNHRATMDFQYAGVYEGFPSYIYQEYQSWNKNNIGYFPYVDFEPLRIEPFVGVYHLGETLGLARSTFTFDHWLSPISFDFTFSGSLMGVMEGEIADTIGYDGEFFYGLTMSIADVFSMRFGGSHYCSHYGDGTYKSIAMGGGVPAEFQEWFKYLRMDSLIFGVSVQPVEWLRVYAELDFPMKSTHIMPNYFSPVWTDYGTAADGVPSSYSARIVNFGIEFEYPIFENLGMTRLAYGCAAYEEGKIVYRNEDLAAAGKDKPFYDHDRPWEFEHTITITQDVNDLVSFDVTWHYGRFMLNSYFSTRSQYVSIGARLDFDGVVTLYDSAKN